MQLVLRHRTASGGALDNIWEIERGQATILACIRVASAVPVHIAIPVGSVRSRDRTRGQYAIAQVDGATFRIEHGLYDRHTPDPRLPGMSLTLANAPPDVARELAEIARR